MFQGAFQGESVSRVIQRVSGAFQDLLFFSFYLHVLGFHEIPMGFREFQGRFKKFQGVHRLDSQERFRSSAFRRFKGYREVCGSFRESQELSRDLRSAGRCWKSQVRSETLRGISADLRGL